MGMIRKGMSVTTLGVIDYRSDKERVARSARLTKRATKRQNHLIKKQNRILAAQARGPREPVEPSAALGFKIIAAFLLFIFFVIVLN
jgi:hypothetical protein